jgi:hypothetical protein
MTLSSFGDVLQGKSKSHTRGCDVSLFGTPWGFPVLSLVTPFHCCDHLVLMYMSP